MNRRLLFINGVAHGETITVGDWMQTFRIPIPNSWDYQEYRRETFVIDGEKYQVMVCGDLEEAFNYFCKRL